METKRKNQYEAPAMQVVEINVEGTLCQSPNNVMVWMLSGETFTSSTSEWGRSGYGDAQSF